MELCFQSLLFNSAAERMISFGYGEAWICLNKFMNFVNQTEYLTKVKKYMYLGYNFAQFW